MIKHHPSPEVLVDYAAGTLSHGMALAVATHAWYCSDCQATIADIETIGGVLMDMCPPVDMPSNAFDAILARLDEPEPPLVAAPRPAASASMPPLPAPLRPYVPESLGDAVWRRVGRLFDELRLPLPCKDVRASIMRFRASSLMPQHTHRGLEYTVVVAGGYTDGGSAYGPGDFAAKDSSDRHQPRVDDDGDCLCLVVLDAPVKLTSAVGRLVNPFLRI